MTVDLRNYDNSWYSPGRSVGWRALWMFVGSPIFRCTWFASSAARMWILRSFGANVGDRVVIRQNVIVKYPWNLVIGNDCWIGEEAWIDNLVLVKIGNNVCVSQGAYLCTGNHDWSDPGFGLRVASITVCDGAWIGAKSIIMPGVTLNPGAIAGAGSVVTASLAENTIAMGNPAKEVRHRELRQTKYSLPSDATVTARQGGLQEDIR